VSLGLYDVSYIVSDLVMTKFFDILEKNKTVRRVPSSPMKVGYRSQFCNITLYLFMVGLKKCGRVTIYN